MENINALPQTKIDWAGLSAKIMDGGEIAQAGKTSLNLGSKSLSVTDGGEAAHKVTVSVPALDTPAVADPATLASISAKIGTDALTFTETEQKEIAEKLSAQLSAVLTDAGEISFGRGVIFDIYQLIALMLAVAQKQRDASREIRKAENEAIQHSIQNQAEMQRQAAITGIAAGIAVCLLQVAAQGYTIVKSAQAYSKQSDVANRLGVDDAQAELKAAKDGYVDLKKAVEIDSATKAEQLAKIEMEVAPEKKAEALTRFKEETGLQGDTVDDVRKNLIAERNTRLENVDGNIQKLEMKLGQMESLMSSHTDFQKAAFELTKFRAIGDIIGAIGGALQGAVRGWTELSQAEATKEGAEHQAAEEQLDQIKDLFSQGQEVVNKVLQLMAAVIQAETESMRDAIRA